jgi:hypothetical protein
VSAVEILSAEDMAYEAARAAYSSARKAAAEKAKEHRRVEIEFHALLDAEKAAEEAMEAAWVAKRKAETP